MNFLELCESQKIESSCWKKWLEENKKDEVAPYELLGLLKEEYEDLCNDIHSIDFYIFKRKHVRHVKNVWGGCYVKYAFEVDAHDPHFEYGWVDVVNNEKGFCKVQCDDSFVGTRALTLRIIDVMEILPYKERPLVYYKTMVCNDCNDCDRMANQLPPETCKLYGFFNAILNKQQADNEFIKLYNKVLNNCKNNNCTGNCKEGCSCH